MRKRFLNEQRMEEIGTRLDATWWQMDEPWSHTEEDKREEDDR